MSIFITGSAKIQKDRHTKGVVKGPQKFKSPTDTVVEVKQTYQNQKYIRWQALKLDFKQEAKL